MVGVVLQIRSGNVGEGIMYIFVVMFHHHAGFSILQMCLHEPCLLLVTTADLIAVMF